MKQLGFERSGPRAYASAETMEGVIELNRCHRLPQHLYRSYSVEVSATVWEQEGGLTVTLLREVDKDNA